MNLDRTRPETASGVDTLARAVNCAVIYLDSLYEQAKTEEALAEECAWFLHRLEQSGYVEGRRIVQAKRSDHNRAKVAKLLKIKELEEKLGSLVSEVVNLMET